MVRGIPRSRAVLYTLLVWTLVGAATEVGLRLAGFAAEQAPEMPARYAKFRPDRKLIWSLKPSWAGLETNGVPVTTNSLGLRGPEIPPRALESRARILFLGDSVTFGHHIAYQQSIPAQVEQLLSERQTRGPGPRVINAGVPGYSTFQSVAYYRSRGRQLGAEVVLLGFCLNDVSERYGHLVDYGGPRFFMHYVDTTAGWSWPRRLWYRSATRAAVVRLGVVSARRGEGLRVERLWDEPGSARVRAAWDAVFGELVDLDRAVQGAGATLAVVVYPFADQLADPLVRGTPQQALCRFLESRDVPCLDLLAAGGLPSLPVDEVYLDADHYSATGAKLVAREVAGFVAPLVASAARFPAPAGAPDLTDAAPDP